MIDFSNALVISVIVVSILFALYERRRNKPDNGKRRRRHLRRDSVRSDQRSKDLGSVGNIRRVANRAVWWSGKIICGSAVILGTFYSVFSAVELYFLLTGRIVPDFEQPSISVVSGMLVFSLILLIVGYKAPKWLDIDRLL